MDLVVNEERLLVASEVSPCDVVNSGVRSDFYWNRFCCSPVMNKHLRDFGKYIVSGGRANLKILWEKILPDFEFTVFIGKYVDGFQR